MEECGKAKVPSVIIISAGFKEMGAPGIKLENEINKYFVTFPFIGLMSEGVSTFNTIYRSKDYISNSLRHYKSYDSTNLSELKINEELAKLIAELYKKKWLTTYNVKGLLAEYHKNTKYYKQQYSY